MTSHLAKMRTSRKVDTIGRGIRLGGNMSIDHIKFTRQVAHDRSTSIAQDLLHRPQS